jgi:ketosteroid isomerase-like protein
MDRWAKGDPSGYMEILADDVTILSPNFDARLDGRAAALAYYEQLRGKVSIPKWEFLNPLVQPLGDGAVLTFNFVSYDASGAVMSRWNFSEVYRRAGARWEIVQSTPATSTASRPPRADSRSPVRQNA